jgi:MerC mercury resistance protein
MRVHHRLTIDTVGFSVSALCAVHCVVMPVLLIFSAFSGLAFLEDTSIEHTILLISLLLAMASLLPSYFRHHKRLTALYTFIVGFVLIGLGRLEISEVWEISTTSIGAALVASAHYINYRLCRACELCTTV